MGYVLRVRLASFFAGAAVASMAGLYTLHNDYTAAHQSISHKMNSLHDSLNGRISALEKLKEMEATKQAEATKEVEATNHVEASNQDEVRESTNQAQAAE
ncbi:uncharacterized protein LOC141695126 [Apium graveolens]|uniref:uncharacterized protein LOC141695126 n=1 Tax=Apium graveolens TaxID=4045 RepID=UPI003D7BF837